MVCSWLKMVLWFQVGVMAEEESVLVVGLSQVLSALNLIGTYKISSTDQ